jgi:CubicO group peptidase (beta-lactamase class C family)
MRLVPLFLAIPFCPIFAAPEKPEYHLPAGDPPLRIPLVWDNGSAICTPRDFDAVAQLHWTPEGLAWTVEVTDNDRQIAAADNPLTSGDHFEIAIANKPSSTPSFRLRVAPSEQAGPARTDTQDLRADRTSPVSVHATSVPNAKGWTLKGVLPWNALGSIPKSGRQIGLNLAAIDVDQDAAPFCARWQGNEDPEELHAVRLTEEAAWSPELAVKADFGTLSGQNVRVAGDAALAGKGITLHDGNGNVFGTAILREDRGRASALIRLPVPLRGQAQADLWVAVDGRPAGLLPSPFLLDQKREKLLAKSQVVASNAVFGKASFPTITFAEPSQVENALGPYRIKTRFFDAKYNEVTTAETPGRYGAVVEITDELGATRKRFLTLCRNPVGVRWHDWNLHTAPRFATEFGWQVLPEQEPGFTYFLKQRFNIAGSSGGAEAALIAALLEKQTEDYQNADARWWIGLKRRLGYYPPAAEALSLAPRTASQPKPVLRSGTEAEAGFKPGAQARLDAICREWAEKSGEPFAVCIARRGVVLLNEGYGQLDGKPMPADAPGWMASISKLSGTLTLMRLVEEGKVDLDAPASRYLPLFKDSSITVRQILTHVSGIGHIGHNWARAWSEPIQDIDAMVASAMYAAPADPPFHYSNAEFDLAGRIVESVTGLPCGEATRQVLFEPLDCKNTYLFDYAGRRSYGSARDYAQVAQMILNGGTYGTKEILRPDTISAMLPRGIPEGGNRPIGLGYDEGGLNGFPGYAPGHGAASGATFRFMPDKDLLVVITRNSFGKDHGKYQTAFAKALAEELE